MTVLHVDKDPENLTMTITAEFAASVERVWQLWADPRKLERWWGPPTHPATVGDHDFVPGGTVTYVMTGPEGEKYGGWWRVIAVDEPHSFEVQDGFADETGAPNLDMPVMTMRVELTERDGATAAVITSTFASSEAMQPVIDMGVEEGLRASMGQMDAVLANP